MWIHAGRTHLKMAAITLTPKSVLFPQVVNDGNGRMKYGLFCPILSFQ